jgi:hypothetical protein
LAGPLDREEEAKEEISATRVGSGAAVALGLTFAAAIGAGFVLEALRDDAAVVHAALRSSIAEERAGLVEAWRHQGPWVAASRLGAAMRELESSIDRRSAIALFLRPPVQTLLLDRMRYGNGQVLVGEEGRLFFHDDFRHVVGPGFLEPAQLERRRAVVSQPDPVPVLVSLASELADRGIAMVVLPVPTKLSLEADRFGSEKLPIALRRNRSTGELLERLKSAHVDVFDPAPTLLALEREGSPAYLRFDSHWSPVAVERVGVELARYLTERFEISSEIAFERQRRQIERAGDLAGLLGTETEALGFGLEVVDVHAVTYPSGRSYRSAVRQGPVLVIGDSFSRIYVAHRRGQGDANLAAQLAFHLGRTVTLRALNDAGAGLARRFEWLREPGFLENRKVVVFEIAERAFSVADWPPLRISPAG